MLIPLLAAIALSRPDTLHIYNSHDHEMAVSATVGTRTVDLGTIQPGDTAAFAVDIPPEVTELELRAYPPGDALSQIVYILVVKPGKKLFWTFEDS